MAAMQRSFMNFVSKSRNIVGVNPRPPSWNMNRNRTVDQALLLATENNVCSGVDFQVRFASLKAVRSRMRSVASISKITKAMKMVAAAKLRGVQARQESSKPFTAGLKSFLKSTFGEIEGKETSGNHLVVAVTSDRGLCGGVNSNVVREIRKLLHEDKQNQYAILLCGDKGRDGLQRLYRNLFVVTIKDVFRAPVNFTQTCVVAEEIFKQKFDSVTIFYNHFKNAISQIVTRKVIPGLDIILKHAETFDSYEFESDMDSAQTLTDLYEFQFAVQLFDALLENATSEQAARMSAMDNATRNASEMYQKLTLTYNRQRQSVITGELIEIISGAEAL
ncbi:hypothetical protein GpartN1_g1979.t1 [Galdieria partita]|uniref:ATP synthase subunit gamma, mitochondrial n=1 Tax=Galdieria partita TaxID=83374 RepID=A0A9C7PT03_9RHOD|nr:hypothetical protein GpartN1_g1979.t1 [Galdieria partita]